MPQIRREWSWPPLLREDDDHSQPAGGAQARQRCVERSARAHTGIPAHQARHHHLSVACRTVVVRRCSAVVVALCFSLSSIGCEGSREEEAAALRADLPEMPLHPHTRCPDSVRTTPYNADMPMALLNRSEGLRLLGRLSRLVDGRVDAQVWVQVNDSGRVEYVKLARGSKQPSVDSLIVRFAYALHYFPSQRDGRSVCTYLRIPIVLSKTSASGHPGARDPR